MLDRVPPVMELPAQPEDGSKVTLAGIDDTSVSYVWRQLGGPGSLTFLPDGTTLGLEADIGGEYWIEVIARDAAGNETIERVKYVLEGAAPANDNDTTTGTPRPPEATSDLPTVTAPPAPSVDASGGGASDAPDPSSATLGSETSGGDSDGSTDTPDPSNASLGSETGGGDSDGSTDDPLDGGVGDTGQGSGDIATTTAGSTGGSAGDGGDTATPAADSAGGSGDDPGDEGDTATASSSTSDGSGTDGGASGSESIPPPTDATPPELVSVEINGAILVLTYSEALDEGVVPDQTDFTLGSDLSGDVVSSVQVAGTTVTLNLPQAVSSADHVMISYTPGTDPLQDLAGNVAETLQNESVTNTTPDTTPPILLTQVVDGTTITLTYHENLDALSTPAPSDYTLLDDLSGHSITGITVSGTAVQLTLDAPAAPGSDATDETISYTPGVNPVRDVAGNAAQALVSLALTNNTPDTVAPALTEARFNGTAVILSYDEDLDDTSVPAPGDFDLGGDLSGENVASVTLQDASVTLSFGGSVGPCSTCSVSYAPGIQPIRDNAGNPAASLSNQAISGSAWTHPEDVNDTFFPIVGANPSVVAMNANGDAVIVWIQATEIYVYPSGYSTESRLYLSEYRGGVWNHPEAHEYLSLDGSSHLAYADVAMDANGDTIVVWRQNDGSNRQIYKAEYRGGTWSTPSSLSDNISPDGTDATLPYVAMDDNGNAIIAWTQSDTVSNQVHISEYRSDAWTHPSALSDNISPDGTSAVARAVAMDNNGNALIVGEQTDSSSDSRVFMSEYRAGAWTHPSSADDVISPGGNHASWTQVAMSDNGDAVIVWSQSDGSNSQVFMSEYRSASWTHPSSLADNISPDGTDVWLSDIWVSLDGLGNTLIAWHQSDGAAERVLVSEYRSGTWSHPTAATDSFSLGSARSWELAMAMDASGNAIVGWIQIYGGHAYTYVSEYRGGSWSHPTGLDDPFSLQGVSANFLALAAANGRMLMVAQRGTTASTGSYGEDLYHYLSHYQ